jgi:hypothetical protein
VVPAECPLAAVIDGDESERVKFAAGKLIEYVADVQGFDSYEPSGKFERRQHPTPRCPGMHSVVG